MNLAVSTDGRKHLRACYMNAENQELTVACSRIVAVPATYYADQVGADRSVMRSVKERRCLLVEGVASKPAIDWDSTDVEFVDISSGEKQEFRVDGMKFFRPGTLKTEITG